MLTCRIQKNGPNCKAQRHKCREQTDRHQVGKSGGTHRETESDMYTAGTVHKQMTNENPLFRTGLLNALW